MTFLTTSFLFQVLEWILEKLFLTKEKPTNKELIKFLREKGFVFEELENGE